MSSPAIRPGEAAGAGVAEETSNDNDRRLQAAGREFLFALYAGLRALMLYPVENQTVQNALQELQGAARRILDAEGTIVVRYVDDLCFVNDLRLRIDLSSYATFSSIARTLKRHEVGHLEAEKGSSFAEWTAVLSLLLGEPDPEDPYARIAERLERTAVEHIHLGPASETADLLDLDRSREVAKRTFTQSVAVVREVMTGIRLGKGVSLRRVKRSVQLIIDQVLTNETSILGMTALRDYDEYTFTHSVNVCIFSLALGKKLGFNRRQLYDLGLGALLHDIGKLRMPVELINKPTSLSDEEWVRIREHPTEGLLTLFGMRGFTELPLRAMLMAYEHHMKHDQTGYPTPRRPRDASLFSRIVAVADGFDAATTKRSYQSQPWPPDHVLREMQQNPARGFDPLLVKAFISMTGIYPVGTLVILDTFELAVVIAPNRAAGALSRPVVRIIYNDMGVPLDPPLTVDLAAETRAQPQRSIIKATDPEQYRINVSDYFI
jgi:HD-GYP domain-containing protein (c-di-GMP phosphodiesterase class II)